MRGRWRVGVEARCGDAGAAAVFAHAVDWDDVPPLPMVGLVEVLSTWVWQDGPETRWWLGAVADARSATDAAERAARAVAERTRAARSAAVAIRVTASAGDRDADEERDAEDIPGADAPYAVPVQVRAYARDGDRLALEWESGAADLAHVGITIVESIVVGVCEHRPPLRGPDATLELLVRRGHRTVVRLPDDVPARLPVLDRYSGEYLAEDALPTDRDPIDPVIWPPP